LVVSPNHGLPLLLGTVTGLALLVHYSVLSHTTWFTNYWQGSSRVKAAVETAPLPQVGELVLPNGTKVKFTVEEAAPQQVLASVSTALVAANVTPTSPVSESETASSTTK
jgi:light-harvesting protein B-800-850 alpha chain